MVSEISNKQRERWLNTHHAIVFDTRAESSTSDRKNVLKKKKKKMLREHIM